MKQDSNKRYFPVRARAVLSLWIFLCMVVVTSCSTDTSDILDIRREVNKVGEVPVSDSVRVSFKLKNCSNDTLTVSLMPECDCTNVSVEEVVLPPRGKVSVDSRVKLDMAGDFQKYIFVQITGSEEFYTVEIRGTAVEESKEQLTMNNDEE